LHTKIHCELKVEKLRFSITWCIFRDEKWLETCMCGERNKVDVLNLLAMSEVWN
jgi:hypothetical protein